MYLILTKAHHLLAEGTMEAHILNILAVMAQAVLIQWYAIIL
jgi:hypothetical protein